MIILVHRKSLVTIILLMIICTISARQNGQAIHLVKTKGKVYKLLNMLEQKTGKMFIYDSDIINNNKKSKINDGDYTLKQAIETILEESDIDLKEIGDHVLISRHTSEVSCASIKTYSGYTILHGKIINISTRVPLANASVSIKGTAISSIANSNGEYRLSIPDTLRHQRVSFSHIGFQTKEVAIEVLRQQRCTIELQEYFTTLQEIVVRMTNPNTLLNEMKKRLKHNYPTNSYRATTFYREGAESNRHFVRLDEGVFHIHKPPYSSHDTEQVKLLKKRDIYSYDNKDSIVAKFKAGIEACMMLDVIKHAPDFLDIPNDDYNYYSTGITTIDDRTANTIYFEQKPNITDPLSCGEIYIDADDYALLGAKFEINPQYVSSATDIFVEKKSKDISIIPEKISYNLSYRQIGSRYYINHVRGDLNFKIRKKHRLFGTSHTHIWFEMATCNIDTLHIDKYDKRELISKTNIFEDTHYIYDSDFWEALNIIPMESNISEAIRKISLKVEEMLPTK